MGRHLAAPRPARRARPDAVLAALLLAAALPGGAQRLAAAPRSGAPADSGVVTHVRVSSSGVEVTRGGTTVVTRAESGRHHGHNGDTSAPRAEPDSVGAEVEVNLPGVHVRTPGVMVHGEGADLVRVFADVRVPPGTTVIGDVVAVFGSATVEGHVTGSVVAVAGSVKLLPGASVDEDAVAVGGALEQAPGSSVRGQTVSVGFLPMGFGPPTLGVELLTIFTGWLLTLFMAWLLSLLFHERLLRVGTTASRRSGASILFGFLSAPMAVIACLLLAVTVIGLPVVALLIVVYPLMVWAGQLAASYLLGCKLLRRRAGEAEPLGPMAAGSAFVAAIFAAGAALFSGPAGAPRTFGLFFTLIGLLLVTGLSVLGTGALLVSRFGSRAREAGAAAPGAPAPSSVPPAPPAPGTLASIPPVTAP